MSTADDRLLSPPEAAHLLGITPELLFAYTIYAPKTHLEHDVRLPTVQRDGHICFRESDLKWFDGYLREPWSDTGKVRAKIPTFIVDYLKVECGGKCARCGKGFKLENAHIEDYAEGRSHHHHNIIRLCSQCHDEFGTQRLVLRAEIETLKRGLVSKIRTSITTRSTDWPSGVSRPPFPAAMFIGRDYELGVLTEALAQHRSVSVEGTGGIGKTQLVLNALQRNPSERPLLWVDVEAHGDVEELRLALSSALAGLKTLSATVPLDQQLDSLKARVVFDGVERMTRAATDALEDFFRELIARTRNAQFVFTSQAELTSLEIDARITLGTLDQEASTAILSAAIEQGRRGDGALKWLQEFCAGHPLTLRLVVGLLRHFKSPSVVAERIRLNGAPTVQHPTRQQQNTTTSLRACLLVSYGVLGDDERRVLWLSAQCPAGCIMPMLEDKAEFQVQDLDAAIASLRRWHLLDLRTDVSNQPRLHVLSPVRAFVSAEWMSAPPPEANDIRMALVRHLTIQAMVIRSIRIDRGDVAFGLFRFSQEFPNFAQAFQLAKDADGSTEYLRSLGTLANSLMVYCFTAGLFDRGIEIMRVGAAAAKQLGLTAAASDLWLQMMALAQRAHRAEFVKAATDELVKLASGSHEPYVLGNAAMAEGDALLAQREFDAAERRYETAVQHYLDAEGADPGSADTEEGRAESRRDVKRMLSLAYKQRGYVNEKAGRPRHAIAFYEMALEQLSKTDDGVNEGAILHGIANCAADSAEHDKAMGAYCAAAEHFHSLGMTEYLSNSLSELGYLLVEWSPAGTIDSLIPEDRLAAGLVDAAQQAMRVFNTSEREWSVPHGVETIRKMVGMLALLSFTGRNQLLDDWARDLRDNFLRPILKHLNEGDRSPMDQIMLMHLDVTLALAGTVSSSNQPNGHGPSPNARDVQHLAMLCYQYLDWGWKAFRPFDWLATYLHRHRGTPKISAGDLLAAAEAAADGGAFFIAGLR